VTGDDSLVFQAKLLIQSPLICYCMMENYFLKMQKGHKLTYLWGSMALKLCLVIN